MPALVRFWRSERGLSIFLGLLLLLVFVLPPLVPPGSARTLVGDTAFALVLLSGVFALSERGLAWRLLMTVAVVAIGVFLASWMVPVSKPAVRVAELASFALLLVVVLGQTFRAGPVTVHRIQGGIAAYVLLGVVWAEAYGLVDTVYPGAFSGAVGDTVGQRSWVYFSFVTLCTVGYGDIVPVHPAARSLAILEAVTGPLYIAILLARLVSLAVAPGAGSGTAGRPGAADRGGTTP